MRVHRLLDLEPHRRAEAAPLQLLLERLEEVLRVVLLDLEVLVAGDPEGVGGQHVHAGEELLEVLADDVLDRHEALVADPDEAAERRRHLDPREVLGAGLRVAYDDREVERQPGDVGERVGGVDGEGRQDREDPVLEELLADLLLLAVELGPPDDLDAVLAQLGQQLAQSPRVPLHQLAALGPQRLQLLARHQSAGRPHGDPGGDASLEAGDADHEELVEVAGEDRQEACPLQQRQGGVLGELEDPLVEADPGDLPVDEAVLVLLDTRDGLGVGLVGRLDVEGVGGVPEGLGDRPFIRRRGDSAGEGGRVGHVAQCGTGR